MERVPASGDLYRHFTDKIYQVVTAAVHAQSGEKMVVYQEMSGNFGVYVMPLAQFLGRIDDGRYPKASQKHLFEQIERTGWPYQEQDDTDTGRLSQDRPGTACSGQSSKEMPAFMQPVRNRSSAAQLSLERAGSAASSQEKAGAHAVKESDAVPEEETESMAERADGTKLPQDASGAPQSEGQGVQTVIELPGLGKNGAKTQDAAFRRPERPPVSRPADAKRASGWDMTEEGNGTYDEKRRRQLEEREQRRGLFRKPQRRQTAAEELRANPCLLRFLEADTYEEKFHVLNAIQDEITDRLIDDMAVVLDVVIPEGPLHDRFHQLKDVILTRQKYETIRFR